MNQVLILMLVYKSLDMLFSIVEICLNDLIGASLFVIFLIGREYS